ncbi:MAG: cadherin-like beta sandwich domain-containing protein, partial [Treponema sp.]|nr:cadherin-like beta sandwich domain-containing protein [Treponema sp.]
MDNIRFYIDRLPILLLCTLALLGGCDSYNLSLTGYIAKELSPDAGEYAFEMRSPFVRRSDGIIVIPPEAEVPGGSLAAVRLMNPRQQDLTLSLGGTTMGKSALEQTGLFEALIRIAGAVPDDEFKLMVDAATTDGVLTFDGYELPPIRCYSFNTRLQELRVSEGTVVSVAGDTTVYRVSVRNEVQDIAITGIPEDTNALIGGGTRRPLPVVGENPPIRLTVTAQNGVTTQEYTVTVIRRERDTKDIVAFDFTKPVAVRIEGTVITITGPFGTPLTAITPIITHTGAAYSPQGPQDFTHGDTVPVVYTIRADDGSTQDYEVWVKLNGQAVVSISFTGLSSDEVIERLDPLSWLENPILNITINSSFAAYQWYLDDHPLSDSGAILNRTAREFTTGGHRITCRLITEGGDIYSSKTVVFMV